MGGSDRTTIASVTVTNPAKTQPHKSGSEREQRSMAQKNRLAKVALFEAVHMNLVGAVIIGQNGDTLVVERPAAKARVKPATPRKPRVKKDKVVETAVAGV